MARGSGGQRTRVVLPLFASPQLAAMGFGDALRRNKLRKSKHSSLPHCGRPLLAQTPRLPCNQLYCSAISRPQPHGSTHSLFFRKNRTPSPTQWGPVGAPRGRRLNGKYSSGGQETAETTRHLHLAVLEDSFLTPRLAEEVRPLTASPPARTSALWRRSSRPL